MNDVLSTLIIHEQGTYARNIQVRNFHLSTYPKIFNRRWRTCHRRFFIARFTRLVRIHFKSARSVKPEIRLYRAKRGHVFVALK